MVPGLIELCICLKDLLVDAESFDDLPERIRIDGAYSDTIQQHIGKLFEANEKYDFNGLTIRVNDEAIGNDEFHELLGNGEPIQSWQILISKRSIVNQLFPQDDISTIWFLTAQGLDRWINRLDPFGESSKIFHEKCSTRVLVCELDHAFGGPSLAIDRIDGKQIPADWPQAFAGPDENTVKRQVHLLSSENTALKPTSFLLSWGDIDSATASRFRMLSGQMLSACLSQEFYDHSRVVLKGSRRIELPLSSEQDEIPSADDLEAIWRAVSWVYEERPEVRATLIADRLTLDLSHGQSLLSGVNHFIEDAMKQSIEQYKFVIAERKDVYAKELRELLKDVQQQASLFSDKVRSILNSLLRDVLAALLLVSLGLFSRIGRTEEILASKEADLLFKALAIYLVVSLLLQLLVHLRDLHLSRGELKYWTNATRNQLGIDDIEKHLNIPISNRRSSFYGMVIILSIVYAAMAIAAWNFQCVARLFGLIS